MGEILICPDCNREIEKIKLSKRETSLPIAYQCDTCDRYFCYDCVIVHESEVSRLND